MADIVEEAVNHILRNSILCVEDFINNNPAFIDGFIAKIKEEYKNTTDKSLKEVVGANGDHYLQSAESADLRLNSFRNNLINVNKTNMTVAVDINNEFLHSSSSLWRNSDMQEIVKQALENLMTRSILSVEDFTKKNLTAIIRALSTETQKAYKSKVEKILKRKRLTKEGNHYLHTTSVKIENITSISSFLKSMNDNRLVTTLKKEFEDRKLSTNMNKKFFLDTTTAEFEYKMMSLSNNFFYRGQSNSNYELIPSVYRLPVWEEKEDELYHDLIVKCPNNFENKKRHIDILKEMQHYSLPTRLLDITQNPLVALYFAVSEHESEDGELVMFYHSNRIKNPSSDTVEILCALASLPIHVKENLFKAAKDSKNIANFNKNDYTKKLLHEIKLAIGSFEDIIDPEDLLGLQFVKPLQDNPRIVRQNGHFIVNGLFDKDKSKLISKYDEKRYKVGTVITRFIIPNDKKRDILKELSLLGINKSTIYPEIDKVSEHLKSYATINY